MGGAPFALEGPVSVTNMYLTPTHARYSMHMCDISSTCTALNQLWDGLIQARYVLNTYMQHMQDTQCTCVTYPAHTSLNQLWDDWIQVGYILNTPTC